MAPVQWEHGQARRPAPAGNRTPGRLRDLKARAPTAQSERREGPGLPMRRRMARTARPRRPHGRSDRAVSRLVSAAANPLSDRPLRPSESKMEGDIQVRFYRDCISPSYILQADRRMVPPPATDSACKQDGSVGTDAVLPRLWPRFPHLATRRATLVGERPQGRERNGESGCRRTDSPSRAQPGIQSRKSITYRQMALNLAVIYRLSINKVLK